MKKHCRVIPHIMVRGHPQKVKEKKSVAPSHDLTNEVGQREMRMVDNIKKLDLEGILQRPR